MLDDAQEGSLMEDSNLAVCPDCGTPNLHFYVLRLYRVWAEVLGDGHLVWEDDDPEELDDQNFRTPGPSAELVCLECGWSREASHTPTVSKLLHG